MDHINKSRVAANNGGVSIATSSTLLCAFNINRMGIIITNAGANPVFLSLTAVGGTALVNTGIYLAANGGAVQLDLNALHQGEINGIAVGGASLVTFAEIITGQ